MIQKLLNLAEVIEQCKDDSISNTVVEGDPNEPNCDQSRPFWVVVVNTERQPPRPKFHTGHTTKKSAQDTAKELEEKSDHQFRYFAINKPDGK